MLKTVTDFELDDDALPAGSYLLCFVCESQFTDSDGVERLAGSVQEFPATASAGRLTAADFQLVTTTDALVNQQSSYRVEVCKADARRTRVSVVTSGLVVPDNVSPPVRWAELRLFSSAQMPRRDANVFSRTETVREIEQRLAVGNPATPSALGRVEMDTAPADPAHPKAVGDNSPLLSAVAVVTTVALALVAGVMGMLRYVSDSVRGLHYFSASGLWMSLLGKVWVADYGAKGDAVIYESGGGGSGQAVVSLAGASITSAVVGKKAVVCGGGSAGATLVSTILSANPAAVPPTITLSTNLLTTVSGAKVVVGTDDTQAFKDAISAAASSLKVRGVMAPVGNFLFATAGGLGELFDGLLLEGMQPLAFASLGYRNGSAGFGPHESKPMDSKGTCLVIACDEGTAAGRFLWQRSNSCVRNLSMFWPANADVNLTAPKVYPWALELYGSNPRAENLQIFNPYNGIYAHIAERVHVRDVVGQPLHIGLYASQIVDTSRFKDISWHPIMTHLSGPNLSDPATPLFNYVQTQAIAYKWGRVDNAQILQSHSYGYATGHKFVVDAPETTDYGYPTYNAAGGRAWAYFSHCITDGAVVGIDIDDTASESNTGQGVTWLGGNINAIPWVPSPTPSAAYTVLIRGTHTGHFTMIGTKLDSDSTYGYGFNLSGSGDVVLAGNTFSTHGNVSLDAFGSGTLTLTGNRFRTTGLALSLNFGDGLDLKGVASGNTFAGNAAATFRVGTNTKFHLDESNIFGDYTSFVEPSLTGWSNLGGNSYNAGYIRRGDYLCLRGAVQGGSSGVTIFTLPAGTRPAKNQPVPAVTSGGHGAVSVGTDGSVVVYVNTGTNAYFGLDGIRIPLR